ncbi:MAG: leucine-rich repeat domain-containing protein [Erysipelotrichaceae bacterium]
MNQIKKRGYTSIEYVLVASLILCFSIYIFFTVYPENTKKVFNAGTKQIMSIIDPSGVNPGTGDVDFSEGGSLVDYPKKELWTPADQFTVSATASGITIVSYIGTNTEVVVPAIINELPVIKIGENAFERKSMQKVNLPSTIVSIGASAFANNQLNYFFSPLQLTMIGDNAFANNKITSVSIGQKVEAIGTNAFKNNNLATIDTVNTKTIGVNAFYMNSLVDIKIRKSMVSIGRGCFLEQGGLTGKAGHVSFEKYTSNIIEDWDSTFDAKFNASKQ